MMWLALLLTVNDISWIDGKKADTSNLVIQTDIGQCIIPVLKSEISTADLDKLIEDYCDSETYRGLVQ